MALPTSRPTDPAIWPAEIVTSVVRLPTALASDVLRATGRLRQADPLHHFYPAESLHLTVRSFRGLLADSSDLTEAVSGLRSELERSVPPTISLRGLTMDDVAASIRVHLHGGTDVWADRARERPTRVNVIRFMGPVLPGLQRLATSMRSVEFGSFVPTEVVVVRCNQVMAPASLTVLERIPLDGRKPASR